MAISKYPKASATVPRKRFVNSFIPIFDLHNESLSLILFAIFEFVSKGHVTYTTNPGYVMIQGPGGVPMAVPVQPGGGMVSVQTTTAGTQESQPQMVLVPVSGATGYQHQYAAATTPHGATSYQPPQVEMPPAYWQGQSVMLENEQV